MHETSNQQEQAGGGSARFICNRRELSQALKRLGATVPRRGFKPILQSVRVDVNGSIELSATDMEIWHTEFIRDCGRIGELSALVPVSRFRVAVDTATGETAAVDLTTSRAKIGAASIQAESAAEFPAFPHFEADGKTRQCSGFWFGSAALLAEMIGACAYACDHQSSRYALGAILIEFYNGNGLRLVATDGRRLVAVETGAAAGEPVAVALWHSRQAAAVVPALKAKAAENVVLRLVQDTWTTPGTPEPSTDEPDDETETSETGNEPEPQAEPKPVFHSREFVQLVTLDETGNAISFYSGLLVEGRFPKWRDVIPNARPVAEFQSTELQAFAAAAISSITDESRGIDLYFRGGGSVVGITRNEFANACRTAPALVHCRARTCIDARFLSEFAKSIGKTNLPVSVSFVDSDSATLWSFENITAPASVPYSEAEAAAVRVRSVIMPLARHKRR